MDCPRCKNIIMGFVESQRDVDPADYTVKTYPFELLPKERAFVCQQCGLVIRESDPLYPDKGL